MAKAIWRLKQIRCLFLGHKPMPMYMEPMCLRCGGIPEALCEEGKDK